MQMSTKACKARKCPDHPWDTAVVLHDGGEPHRIVITYEYNPVYNGVSDPRTETREGKNLTRTCKIAGKKPGNLVTCPTGYLSENRCSAKGACHGA